MVKPIGQSQGSKPLSGPALPRESSAPASAPTVDSILLKAVGASRSAAGDPAAAQVRVVSAAKDFIDSAAGSGDPAVAAQARQMLGLIPTTDPNYAAYQAKVAALGHRDGAAPAGAEPGSLLASTSSTSASTTSSTAGGSSSDPQASFNTAQQELSAAHTAYQSAISNGSNLSAIAQGIEAAQQQAMNAYQAAAQAAAQLGPAGQAQLSTMYGQLKQMGFPASELPPDPGAGSGSTAPSTASVMTAGGSTTSVAAGGPTSSSTGSTPLPLGPLPTSSSTAAPTNSSSVSAASSSSAVAPPSPAQLAEQFRTAEAALGQAITAYSSASVNGDQARMATLQEQALEAYQAACNALGQMDPATAAPYNDKLENDEEAMMFYKVAEPGDMAPFRRAANLDQSPATAVAQLPPLTSSSSASATGSTTAPATGSATAAGGPSAGVSASSPASTSTSPTDGSAPSSATTRAAATRLRAPMPADGAAPGSASTASTTGSSAPAADQAALVVQFDRQEQALSQALMNFIGASQNQDPQQQAADRQQVLAAYTAAADTLGQMDPNFRGAYDNRLSTDEESLLFYNAATPNDLDPIRKAAKLDPSPVTAWSDANQNPPDKATQTAQQQLSQMIPKMNSGAVAKLTSRQFLEATDQERGAMVKTLLNHWWINSGEANAASSILSIAGVGQNGQATLQALDAAMGGTPKGIELLKKLKGNGRASALSDLFQYPGSYSSDYLAQVASQLSKSDVETLLNAKGFDVSSAWFQSLPPAVKQVFAKTLSGNGGGLFGWFKGLFGNSSNTQAMIQALQAGTSPTSSASTGSSS